MAEFTEDMAVPMKKSLVSFVFNCTGQNVEGNIDDILVNYLLAMVDPDLIEDDFDVGAMREMLSAYIPVVDQIPDSKIERWARDASALWSPKTTAQNSPSSTSFLNFKTPPVKAPKVRQDSSSDESACKAKSKIEDTPIDESVLIALAEMFPRKNSLRIRKCLIIANGDVDTAAQLLLQDEGMGVDELVLSSTELTAKSQVDEKTLREQIINRYAYVDVDEDKKEFKPAIPKAEPKKLIRYRDNKVVSIKGERFSLEKTRQETEN